MTFLVLFLASYRVTRFITKDTLVDGPRRWFYLRFPPTESWAAFERKKLPNGQTYWQQADAPTRQTHKLGELLNCSWCIGFWIAGVIVLLALPFTSIPLPVLWWLAISTAVGLTSRNLDA